MNLSKISDYAAQLEHWYWQYGYQREEPYSLPPSRWLLEVARCSRSLKRGVSALEQKRPAMAIWGPSQTGKSTLISAYMDSGARYEANPEVDGEDSGLHWQDGKPYFFMAPQVDNPDDFPHHMTRRVLNPFNKGMDGSACLTRFVPAAEKSGEGYPEVEDPAHPVTLHLVSLEDLWHALARGYSTECLVKNGREPKAWDLERIKRATREVLRDVEKPAAAKREAFDELLLLTEVLEDLATSDDRVFSELSIDRDAWETFLRGLFDEPALLCSREHVRRLAERILWDGSEPISQWFRAMVKKHDSWLGVNGRWRGRRILCSLEAASLFLNMGASEIAYGPRESGKSPRSVIQEMIAALSCQVDSDTVRISCDGGTGEKLGGTADDFSILQGLVWELVVPINMAHLAKKPFKEDPQRPNALKQFLQVADILDFPGVGNETKSLENRVITDAEMIRGIEERAQAADTTPQDQERLKRCFSPILFFKEILKRGKTASIVATYGKRLNIDAFSIFQGARHYACPNADQIINGVKTWWRHLTPDYYQDVNGRSPFPLNLVITWWAKQLNLASNPSDSNIYGVIESIVSNLGIIRDANVSTTFAIHDHRSPDRDSAEMKLDFSPGSQRYKNLTSETHFKQQFASEVSRDSFDAMLTDKLTGGAEYFFDQATLQMQLLEGREDGRHARILEQVKHSAIDLMDALAWPDLVPQPKVKDTRRECIEDFLLQLNGVLENASAAELRALNRYCRDLLNVRPADIPSIPSHGQKISKAYIERVFDTWVASHSQWMLDSSSHGEAAHKLGLDEAEALRTLLRALVDSLQPDHSDNAHWLRERIAIDASDNSQQLMRLFALRLGNTLVYGKTGPRTSIEDPLLRQQQNNNDDKDPYLRYFLEPLAGKNGRLAKLAAREIQPRKRPDLAGDDEIRQLFEKAPTIDNEPAANSTASQ